MLNKEFYQKYFSNDPNSDTDVYNENAMINELMDEVRNHDYSYMMSDDNRHYDRGELSEKRIERIIHTLVSLVRVDAERLLEDCLYERDEQYLNGLTHKTIRNWFKPYVENVDNIFVKPKFDYE
jgi:hypothetical protein